MIGEEVRGHGNRNLTDFCRVSRENSRGATHRRVRLAGGGYGDLVTFAGSVVTLRLLGFALVGACSRSPAARNTAAIGYRHWRSRVSFHRSAPFADGRYDAWLGMVDGMIER